MWPTPYRRWRGAHQAVEPVRLGPAESHRTVGSGSGQDPTDASQVVQESFRSEEGSVIHCDHLG